MTPQLLLLLYHSLNNERMYKPIIIVDQLFYVAGDKRMLFSFIYLLTGLQSGEGLESGAVKNLINSLNDA